MFVSIGEAGKKLDDLVSDVEAGGEVILTRGGRAVARMVVVDASPPDGPTRRASIQAARRLAQQSVAAGDTAARSQDFLHADDGLPG